MDYQNEAELKVMTLNMYRAGGVPNVLDSIIIMLESQLIILRKLKEILNHTGD